MKEISEELYVKIIENIPICCVDVMVLNDKNDFLLVKRLNEPEKGEWWPIGGRLFKGELLEEAVRRKVKEEINGDVKEINLVGPYETIFKSDSDNPRKNVHSINTLFIAKLEDYSSLEVDSTSETFKWIPLSEDHSNLSTYVRKYIESIKEIVK